MTDPIPATLPNGDIVLCTDQAAADRFTKVAATRHEVARAYCESKGWPLDAAKLSMKQIMEIRALPAWKAAAL